MKKPIGRKYISGVIKVAKRQYAICDEEGSGLVMTLMALLVLSILGISLGLLTVGSFRLSDANRDDTSAYYIAEAGAVKALNDLELFIGKKYEDAQTKSSYYDAINAAFLTPKKRYDFDSQYGDETFSEVSIALVNSDPIAGEYMITSTGHVGKRNRTVNRIIKVNWIEKGGSGLPSLPEKAVLVSRGETEFNNGSISGNVYIDSTKNNYVKITGNPTFTETTLFIPETAKKENLITYPKWYEENGKLPQINHWNQQLNWEFYDELFNNLTIPIQTERAKILEEKPSSNVIDDKGNVKISGGLPSYELSIEETEIYIPSLQALENIPVTLKTDFNHTTIFVDSFTLNTTNFQIKEGKNVTIVVKDKLSIQANANLNSSGLSKQLTIIYLGNQHVALGGWSNPVINANIFLKQSNLSANSSQFNGVLYTGGNEVVLSGGVSNSSMMLIAPKAKVTIGGSYSMSGSIIANSFLIDGGTKITYKAIDTSEIPLMSSETTSPTLEDLIESGPIIETQGE